MQLPGFQIDDLRIDPGLVLAPMSGVTDSPYRRLVKRCSGAAVGLVMSEFIAVEGLTRRSMTSMVRMSFDPSEQPVAIQVYGSDPKLIAEAARIVEQSGAAMVDLNCGCPAPKVVKRGGGAGLLKDLRLLGEILEGMATAVSIPVTVKIRNGWCDDTLNAMETLRVAEESGARMISVHGRTRLQLYRGEADWDIIRELKRVARIPVLGSGDILTASDAAARLRQTGCDGVMIGRGSITNPWVFRQIADEFAGRTPYLPTWRERIDAVAYYRDLLVAHYPPKVVPGRMKMMLSRLLKGAPDVRVSCLRQRSPADMLDLLYRWFGDRELLDSRDPIDAPTEEHTTESRAA